ncbi:hypothetical protein [Desulfotomaculum copahuensis]|uniref:Uncharacterized protein n=1 Tax=Desulfotomaculum copahuensis TaxID=1838280 RepID=A0A1B7LCM2_9FIRM|nr:hypothetical protein [Desulfotomaculum copahuensis]OAT80672.1 hypothetical protein A6M21_13125 [Desulfotomaculum copahuensis]
MYARLFNPDAFNVLPAAGGGPAEPEARTEVLPVPQSVDGAGMALFPVLIAAGLILPPFFKALSLAADLFPLKLDLESFLGITGEHPVTNEYVAMPSLLVFLLLIFLAVQSESFFWAINAAGDLLPVPGELALVVD